MQIFVPLRTSKKMFTELHFTIVEADVTDILQPITPGLLLLGRQLGVSSIHTVSSSNPGEEVVQTAHFAVV